MISLGLIGKNISYSLSPEIYRELAEKSQIEIDYKIFDIDNIEKIKKLFLTNKDLLGFNVTIPYKSQIISQLDYVSPEASKIGAVNCVVVDENKKMTGYNTDWLAFRDTFISVKEKNHYKAIILGSGGAAKAVAYALQLLNVDFVVLSRNTLNVNLNFFQEKNIITYEAAKFLNFREYNILINATPCGTLGTNFDLKNLFPFNLVQEKSLFYDLVYNPHITPFMEEGINRNCIVKNGRDMLFRQAEATLEIVASSTLATKVI